MEQELEYTAKELKVRTGEVLDRVAEGKVVYVTRNGKYVARIEPMVEARAHREARALERRIDEIYGRYRDLLPSTAELARQRRKEERRRDRR